MRYLLAIGMLPLACLHAAAADDTSPVRGSAVMLCAQEGVAKGYTGRELEDFVAKCMRARQSGSEVDSAIMEAASGC